jgi:hypothetical protein
VSYISWPETSHPESTAPHYRKVAEEWDRLADQQEQATDLNKNRGRLS